MLLGGFGMAVADTGGGAPKKGKGAVFSVVDVSVTGGGSTSSTIICAGGQTVILEPSLSSLSSTSSVSFTILRGTDLPITATVGASPYTLPYIVTGVSGPTGLTVIARDNSAFPSTFTKVFTLVPPPTNVVTASSASICQGSSVTFTQAQSSALTLLANGATTGGTGTTSVVTTPSATGPQTFSFTGVDIATGCSFTSTVSVNIVANPTGTIVASPNPVCAGQTVSFSVAGSTAISATVLGAALGANISPFISTTTSSPVAPDGTFSVSYTLTGAGGCTALQTTSYSVVALPSNGPAITLVSGTTNIGTANATAASATLTPSGSVSVCQNSTLTLSLSGCAAVTGGGSSSGASTSVVVAPGYIIITSASGTQITVANGITSYALPTTAVGDAGYQIACYNSLGCSSTSVASLTVTVLPTPAPPTVVSTQGSGSSFTICSGRSFSATIGCPTGETANASSAGANIILGGAGSNVFNLGTGTQPDTFTIAATCRNASCTSVTTNFTVVVIPSPAMGPSVTVNSETQSIIATPPLAVDVTLINASVASLTRNITVCQNSVLSLSVANCSVAGSNSLTNPITEITSPGTSVGVGASVTAAGGGLIDTYVISTSNVTPAGSGPFAYSVVCVNANGCSSTAVAYLNVTVMPAPTSPTVTGGLVPNGVTYACIGTTLSGTIACPTGSFLPLIPNGNYTGWLYSIGVSDSPYTFTPTTPGSQTFSTWCYDASMSCPSRFVSFTVITNPTPAVPTGIAASLSACLSSPVNVTAVCTSSTAVFSGAQSLTGGTQSLATNVAGVYPYSVVCTNGFCQSAPLAFTLTVQPRPANASLTAVNGTPANLAVAGGSSGSVSICQGLGSLTVLTNCFIASASSSNSANVAVGNNGGVAGVDGTTAAVGGGSAGGTTSTTFASFAISTTATGTTNFTFVCQNQFGCTSPIPTTLSVTVNASAVAPTAATAVTVCENSGNVIFATGCGTNAATIVSRPAIEASSASIVSNSLVLGSVLSGTFVYGVQCRTSAGCSSTTTSYTLIVNPRPDNANLTVVNGTIADRNVAGGTLGSVSICQGASLTVNTNCLIATGSTTGTVNPITGVNSGSTGTTNVPDGLTAAQGGGVGSNTTSSTFAAYTIATAATGISTYTFVCVNALGCPSPLTTTLVVTVNATPAAPTFTGTQTACLNSNALTVAATCSTPTGASLVITGAGGVASIADVNSTTATGTRSYTLQCVTQTCVSSTTTVTVIVRPRPVAPSLTPSAGGPVVASAGSGTLVVCQGATGTMPLSVTTSCVLATAATSASGTNGLGGVNIPGGGGATATDGSTASAGGAVGTGGTSTTFASFSLGTANTGTTTYTFVCVNEFGCASPDATTLTVTVNSSVAAPTFAGTTTACQNASPLTLATTCSTAGSSPVYTSVPGGLTATLAQVRSTATVGSFTYTVQCVTPTCASSASTIITTIRPLPANAGLTVNSGSTTLATIAAGGSGSVPVCQGQSLTVVTSCVINTSTASGSANVATGLTSGSVNQDGSVVAIANGVTDGTSSVTYAAFVISTSAVNTTTFTFQCQNQYGCTSPIATTLALTVSNSVAAPTGLASRTVCLNDVVNVAAVCATAGSVAVYSGAQSLTGNAQTLATSAPGTFVYSVVCRTSTCSSTAVSFTLVVNPRPNNASLTAVNGVPANLDVAGGTSGSVAICQGAPLLVNTDCVIGTIANPSTGTNTIGGTSGTATAGTTGTDGSTASVGGVIVLSGSSNTFASFTITTTNVGTNSYTFVCVNQFGCTSPQTTTLTVTVNASVVAPTGSVVTAGVPTTVCQFATLNAAAGCASGTTAVFSGAQSFTGSPLAVNTTTPGTFVYSVVCRTTTCVSASRSFTVVVNAQPNNAIVDVTTSAGAALNVPGGTSGAITICEGTSLTGIITACPTTSATTGGGTAAITGSGQVSVGGSSPVSTTSSMNTFTIPGSLTAGTYNYTVVCVSVAGSATCTSPLVTSLVVTVNGAPVSPTANYASTGLGASTGTIAPALNNPTSITTCQNSPTSLTVFGCNAATAGTTTAVSGQASNSAVLVGSQAIAGSINNGFFTIANETSGTFQYTFVCQNGTTGCKSLTPLILNITVNPTPAPATVGGGVSTAVATTVCQLSSLKATITCPAGSTVQATAALGSPATGGIYTVPTSAVGTTTYSVTCISTMGACPSPVRTFVVVVNPIPDNAGLTVNPATVVGGSSVSTIAGGGGGALTICQGNPISVTVTGCPTSDTASSSSALGPNTSGGSNFGGVQLIPGGTGVNAFTIGTATTGTFVYTATCTNSFGCSSSVVTSLTVTVNPTPAAPTINSGVTANAVTTVCQGQSLIANITCPTGSTLAYSVSLTRSGNNYTVPTGTAATTAYSATCIATQGGCLSTPVNFTVTVRPLPNNASLTVVSPPTTVAGAGTGSITVCQGSPIRVNTDCLIGSVISSGTGNSLTGVNSGSTGGNGVIDNGTSSSVGVGGGQVGGGTTLTYASFNLGTSIATTTTYTFVCVNQYGCVSPTATTLNVTVNAVPPTPAPTTTAGLLPAITVCETTTATALTIASGCPTGTSMVVAKTGTIVGAMSGSNAYVITTSGLAVNTSLTGSLTILCQNTTTGCVSPVPYVVSVTVNSAPARPTSASISAGTPPVVVTTGTALTICQGQPVSLTVDGCQIATGSGGGTALNGTGSGFVFTGSGFTFTPTSPMTFTASVTDGNLQQGTYTFDVRCTNVNGCQSLGARSFTLVVTGQPSAVAVAGFAPTCPPTSAVGTLGCSAGNLQYGIANGPVTTGLITTGTSPVNVTLPATAGIYTLTAVCTTGGACVGTPVSLTVYNRLRTPAPVSVQTVQNAICLGQSTTLIAGCATGSTATWYIANTNQVVSGTTVGTNSLIVLPLQQGTYNYEATCTNPLYGCASVRSTEIVLTVLPGVNSLPTISAQPNPTVAGAPVTLSGAGCAGTTIFYIAGTNTEVGRGNGGLVSLTVTPQTSTTYDAVCTNGQCTSNRTTGLVVSVIPCTFTVTVTPSSAVICATGGSVQLTASGGQSYVWNNGANTQQITVSAAGVYNVVVTSAQGCTAMASATITTGTAPSPTITGNTNIFAGASTTLTAGGGGLYAWSGPGLAPNAGGASQVVSQPGGYTVTVTSPTGCTASASVVVTNIALPPAPTVTPTAAVQPNATLQACVGQTVQLIASCPVGSAPRFKIGSTTNDATTQNVMSSTPGTIIYNVVCVAGGVEGPSTFAQVVFNGVPTVQILQTGVLCTNTPTSATLSATGATSYTWSTGATTQSIVVNSNATGLYSVNGANAAGCVGTASQMVSATTCGAATVMMITGATIDCVNGNVTIAATGGNGNQKQYSIGGAQYSASNPVALDPAFQNNPANSFISLFVRQVNSTNTGFDVAGPFQFNFRAVCPVVSQTVVTPPNPVTTTSCNSPTATFGQPFVVSGVTDINCLNGSFRVLTTGGNGSAIDFSVIVGLSNADPNNCVRKVDNGEQLMAINNPNSTIQPFRIDVMQNGALSAPFFFDFKLYCTGQSITTPPPSQTTTPPPSNTTPAPPTNANTAGCGSPANTVGQPLTITGVDQVNCATGTFRILTAGGSGNTINYANIVGLSNTDPYNCTRTLDNPDLRNQVNNPSSTIAPFQLRVMNVGGATSNIYSFNFKQACTGVARTARTEGSGTLDVTVLGNPTLGETVEVEVRGAEGQALQLRLVDGLGAAISEKSVEKAGATERQTISLGRSAGMYFLQVTTPDKSKTVKVVRQ